VSLEQQFQFELLSRSASENFADSSVAAPAPAAVPASSLPLAPAAEVTPPAGLPPLQNIGEFPPAFRHRVRHVRSQYKELYDLPVVEHEGGRRTFHQGTLYRHHGLYVLFLKGDWSEMAFQHGRLLASEILAGCVQPSATQVERAIANAYGKYGPLQRLIVEGIHRFLTNTMLNCALTSGQQHLGEEETFDETIALADATGLPAMTLIRALFGPEVLLLLANIDSDARRVKVPVRTELATPISCSSFAAWGSTTRDGNLLIGRNMDYPLNNYYDQFPTVIYYEPTDGTQRHMGFASAGIHNSGLNGYNESGLFVATHSIPSTEVSASGVPVFTTAQHAIRHAHTFDEAVSIFRLAPPAAGWGYILVSAKEGRVGTLECTNKRIVVRESEGEFHVQTNHYLSPELREKNLLINTSVAEDNDGRYIRIKERLEEAKSRVDAAEAISILSDQIDPYVNEPRALGSTVGVHSTMTSLVIEPAKGTVLMATGRAPVCHGPYVELPLVGSGVDSRTAFEQPASKNTPPRVLENKSFREEHPEQAKALQLFIEAKAAYEYDNNFVRAYGLLRDVVKVDDTNPAYFFQLGIFALKCRDYEPAITAFDGVFTRPYVTPQLRRLAHYYRGRALAHLSRREAALSDFAQVEADPATDSKLRSANLWASRTVTLFGSQTLRQKSLNIMMQQSDMLHY
jgi:tetratricopeptide (TPR) repeat protein